MLLLKNVSIISKEKMVIYKLLRSSLFRNAGVYTIANVVNSSIPFLLLPILTRYLSPIEYGYISMFLVLVGFFNPLTGLSIHGAICRQYYERDSIDFPKYVTNCLGILLISSCIIGVVLFWFSKQISVITLFSESWLWVLPIFSSSQFIVLVVLVLWQVQRKTISYATFMITQTLTNVGISLWLVVGMRMGWQGRIEGQLAAIVIFAVLGLCILYRNGWLKFSIDSSYIKNALKFGVPLVPHALGGWVFTMMDKLFIANIVGIADAGIYAVGYQIGMIISVVESSCNQAWVPWLYEKLKSGEEQIKIKIVRFTYAYFAGILSLAFLLSLIGPKVINVFIGEKFSESGQIIIWIAIGFALNGMYKMVANYIFYSQKTYMLTGITFFSAIVNIMLNYVLIRANGIVGAAQAATLTYLLFFLSTWYLSNRVFDMPWFEIKKLINKK